MGLNIYVAYANIFRATSSLKYFWEAFFCDLCLNTIGTVIESNARTFKKGKQYRSESKKEWETRRLVHILIVSYDVNSATLRSRGNFS